MNHPFHPSHQSPQSLQNSTEKKKLIFRPVNDGLGFHPFSDGLPYAPISQNSKKAGASVGNLDKRIKTDASLPPGLPMGSGATVAGVSKIARTITQSDRSQTIPRISVPTARMPGGIHPAEKSLLPIPSSMALGISFGSSWGVGYSFRRMIAYGIDLIMNTFLLLLAVVGILWRQDSWYAWLPNSNNLFLVALVWLAFQWFFTTFQEVLFKATLGKRILGLSLPGSRGLLLLRATLFIPSIFFIGLGIFSSLFDIQKRCWHDRIIGIQPLG